MFSSNFCKIFLVFALAFCSSCRFWQASSNSNSSQIQTNVSEIKSEVPFSTREPEIFQAEFLIKNQETEERLFFYRSSGRTVIKNGEIATLQNAANKTFYIDFGRKIYVENTPKTKTGNAAAESLNDFLTIEWLNQKTDVAYENLGVENGLTKYRVSFESSESIIFVDENYKMPVKQEFYSIEGERREMVYSMEIQNIKLQVDENIFEIPKDFRKVSAEEFRSGKTGND